MTPYKPIKPYKPTMTLGNPAKLEPEFEPTVTQYQANPMPENATSLLKAVDPILQQGVSLYGGTNANPMMFSRARRIALDAVKKYDPARGTSLKTHLMSHLQGLRRYGARQTQVLSVPEQVALDQFHLQGSERELRDELGRDPSNAELADRTGVSLKRLAYVRGYRPGFAESQLAGMVKDDEGEPWEPAVQGGVDPLHNRAEFLYPDLDPQDQLILEYTLGLHGAPKLRGTEIARRVNLSPGRVSQRAAAVRARLDELEDLGVL